MRSSVAVLALVTLTAAAVAAQNPPTPAGPPMGAARGGTPSRDAQLLLARSAELGLTDAQVVRLAGIARRAETRRASMRAAMDSGRTRFTGPGDSVARRQFAQRMRDGMEKERDLSRTDLRDAIAVLTPDQHAKAWEINAQRGARGGPGGRGGAMRGGRGVARPPRGARPGRDGFGPDARAPRDARPDRMGPGRPGMQRDDMRDRRPAPRRPLDEFSSERNPE